MLWQTAERRQYLCKRLINGMDGSPGAKTRLCFLINKVLDVSAARVVWLELNNKTEVLKNKMHVNWKMEQLKKDLNGAVKRIIVQFDEFKSDFIKVINVIFKKDLKFAFCHFKKEALKGTKKLIKKISNENMTVFHIQPVSHHRNVLNIVLIVKWK